MGHEVVPMIGRVERIGLWLLLVGWGSVRGGYVASELPSVLLLER
jgi:hypothetical protein